MALDVDGTIADYHGHFLRFAEGYFGRPFPSPHSINPGLRLSEFMGINHNDYRKCKLAYRQGGLKRSMPPLRGIDDLVYRMRSYWGVQVWICTTRPFNSLSNIDEDTQEFLRRNGIGYDAIIFDALGGDEKYWELRRQANGRIAAVVEDLPEQAKMAMKLGLGPVLLHNQPYNQGPIDSQNVHRWTTVMDLEQLLHKAIKNWRETRASASD